MQSKFRVDVRNDSGAIVITVAGELDLASSPELQQQLESALNGEGHLVILDLRMLDFMDSTGLSVVVKAHQAAVESGRELHLVKGPPQVQRLLSLTGVEERISLFDTPEEALSGS